MDLRTTEQKIEDLEKLETSLAKDVTDLWEYLHRLESRLQNHIDNGATVHAGQLSNVPKKQEPEG